MNFPKENFGDVFLPEVVAEAFPLLFGLWTDFTGIDTDSTCIGEGGDLILRSWVMKSSRLSTNGGCV